MEVLNFVSGYFGVCVFPYISPIHAACISEDSSILGTKKLLVKKQQKSIIMGGRVIYSSWVLAHKVTCTFGKFI